MSKFGDFFGLSFPAFGLNTGIYFINVHTQSEYEKYGSAKSANSDTFHKVNGRLRGEMKRFSLLPQTKIYSNREIIERKSDNAFPLVVSVVSSLHPTFETTF